jgi:hypothetical protein
LGRVAQEIPIVIPRVAYQAVIVHFKSDVQIPLIVGHIHLAGQIGEIAGAGETSGAPGIVGYGRK